MKIFGTLVVLGLFAALNLEAKPRTGVVSFEGVMVRVTVDEEGQAFKIGESEFKSPVRPTPEGRVMAGSRRVGIMTWDETLFAVLFLDGGKGNLPNSEYEYSCSDIRVSIFRIKDDGTRTIVKNECAFLN